MVSLDPTPPFASVASKNGVTQFEARPVFGKWFKICLGLSLAAFIVLLATFSYLINLNPATESWPGWPLAAGEIICGLFLFGFLILGVSCAAITAIKAQIRFNGSKIRLKDFGATYEIPIEEIRAIRQVKYPGSRLEFDPGGRPGRIFFRGIRTALEITTSQGRIEFFRCWGKAEVTWLTAKLHSLIFPAADLATLSNIDPSNRNDLVIAAHSYGKGSCLLPWSGVAIGIIASTVSGWYAYQGLTSRYWPTVQGHVTHSLFEKKRNTSYAEIQYTYTVDGVSHSNDDFGFSRSPSDAVVKGLIAEHPDGAPLTVYYKPSEPANSIVIPGLGALHWLPCVASVSPFLIAIPFILRRTTPAQIALACRYKISPPAVAKTLDLSPPILQWSTPDDAWQNMIRSLRWSALAASARIITVTALALWAAHHWIAPYCLPDVRWNRINQIVMGFVVVQAIAIVLPQFLRKRQPPDFEVTEEGLSFSKVPQLIRWKNIASFTVQPDNRLRDRRVLSLHFKSGVRRDLPMPSELEASILAEFSHRLLQAPPPAKASPLKPLDWLVSLILIASLIWAMFFVFHPMHRQDAKLLVSSLTLAGLLAGPGTWIAIFLRRRRAAEQLVPFALALNLIATVAWLAIFLAM